MGSGRTSHGYYEDSYSYEFGSRVHTTTGTGYVRAPAADEANPILNLKARLASLMSAPRSSHCQAGVKRAVHSIL
eukprot:scaffold138639_cov17-Prasinocladus_malaysianus.AAC.1